MVRVGTLVKSSITTGYRTVVLNCVDKITSQVSLEPLVCFEIWGRNKPYKKKTKRAYLWQQAELKFKVLTVYQKWRNPFRDWKIENNKFIIILKGKKSLTVNVWAVKFFSYGLKLITTKGLLIIYFPLWYNLCFLKALKN